MTIVNKTSSQQSIQQDELDLAWMRKALVLAEQAAGQNEVPVGAIITLGDQWVADGFNRRETSLCATHHAEILAIEAACRSLGRWRLTDCTLYVTLEPCVMCAGAIVNSRLQRVVYGAHDPKAGAVQSLYQVLSDERLNHRPSVQGGLLATECGELLSRFFRQKRAP